jgi:hypothetical protein
MTQTKVSALPSDGALSETSVEQTLLSVQQTWHCANVPTESVIGNAFKT